MPQTIFFAYLKEDSAVAELSFTIDEFRVLAADTQIDVAGMVFGIFRREYNPVPDRHYLHCLLTVELEAHARAKLIDQAVKEGWTNLLEVL